MPRIYQLCIALLLTSLSVAAHAQAGERYQIDLVIYANNDPSANSAESWPDNLHLRYPRDWAVLDGNGDGNLSRVSDLHPNFAKALRSLKLSSRYRILLQESWVQDLQPRRKAPAILLRGGAKVGEHHELEGYVRIALERYLYAETDLWLSRFGSQGGNYYLPRQPYRPALDTGDDFIDESFENSPEYAEFQRQNNLANPPLSAPPAGAEPVERIVAMQQQRRMRSDELHYIDHPLFGLLIIISKPQASVGTGDSVGQQ